MKEILIIAALGIVYFALWRVTVVNLSARKQVSLNAVVSHHQARVDYYPEADCECPECKGHIFYAPHQENAVKHHACLACRIAFISPKDERLLYRKPMATRLPKLLPAPKPDDMKEAA
jgi:Zn ribbon nucleic-acid-binding protein